MKSFYNILLCFLLFSCGAKSAQEAIEQPSAPVEAPSAEPKILATANTAVVETENEPESYLEEVDGDFEEYATYYVTIADTGRAYYPLRAEMVRLSKETKLPIDTMGRYYDVKKDLIALPENDEDEIYAGNYYPRRGPDVHLSLEYLNLYQEKAREKTMALVSGIYEKEASADSALAVLKKSAGKAFVVKTKMYVGCIH